MTSIKLFHGTVMAGKTKLLSDFLSLLHPSEYILIVPNLIYQNGKSYVKSRSPGYQKFYPGVYADSDTNLYECVLEKTSKNSLIRSVFVEEIQFYTKKQVDELYQVSNEIGIKVLCFGISRNHRNEEWDTIKYLESVGCIIQEICTTCNYCNEVARTNIRYDADFSAEPKDCINDDGIEKYLPCCLVCWKNKFNESIKRKKGWCYIFKKMPFINKLFSSRKNKVHPQDKKIESELTEQDTSENTQLIEEKTDIPKKKENILEKRINIDKENIKHLNESLH